MTKEAEILEKLANSILELEAQDAEIWAKKSVEAGIDPIRIAKTLTEAIRQVGDAFGRGDIYLPELMMAAEAMNKAMPIIEEELDSAGKEREAAGTLVIGTVEGDIHDIGKTLVATLFEAAGCKVIDLGVNVLAEKFVEAVKE